MRVLAIDPGYGRMGLAVVEGNPSTPLYVYSECVETDKSDDNRLATISDALQEAINCYCPDMVAMELLFFSTNVKTALKVGEARGALISVVQKNNIPLTEFSPQAVKLAVTGFGNADKRAVSAMVPKLLTLPPKKRRDDELDALALGICALAHRF